MFIDLGIEFIYLFWTPINFKTLHRIWKQKAADCWQQLTEQASSFFHLSPNLLFAQLFFLSEQFV